MSDQSSGPSGLIATARRIASRQWTVGPEGAVEVTTDPYLAELVKRGLARLYFTPAYKRADDYWMLTPDGEQWLADQEDENSTEQDTSAEPVCGESYDHDLKVIDSRDGITAYECRECGAEVVDDPQEF